MLYRDVTGIGPEIRSAPSGYMAFISAARSIARETARRTRRSLQGFWSSRPITFSLVWNSDCLITVAPGIARASGRE